MYLTEFSFSNLSQVVTNCKNTVQGFKRFHGRAFSDPYVQRLKNSLVYDIAQMPTGTTGIKVREERGTFTVNWICQCLVLPYVRVKTWTNSIDLIIILKFNIQPERVCLPYIVIIWPSSSGNSQLVK